MNLKSVLIKRKIPIRALLSALALLLLLAIALPCNGTQRANPTSDSIEQSGANESQSAQGAAKTVHSANTRVETPKEKKTKDWWDKATVISQFFAGVVIAVVGLLITYTIQKTQVRASRETAGAQMKSAEYRAKEERKLQQGQLTAQLVQHLVSNSDVEREIALVALSGSVPENKYNSVTEILARDDASPKVRKAAIEQLGLSTDARVAQTLGGIVADPGRPKIERDLAIHSASRVSVSSDLLPGTFVLAASSSIASDQLGGGVFTHFLIKGLSGEADVNTDGTITANEIKEYLMDQVRTYSSIEGLPTQSPQAWMHGSVDLPILGEQARYSELIGVVVGVADFSHSDVSSLPYSSNDAKALYDLLGASQIPTPRLRLLIDEDATYKNVFDAILAAASDSSTDSLFIFYFSGHGIVNASGEASLVAFDSDPKLESSTINITQIKAALQHSAARARVLFLDSSYSGLVTRGIK